MLRLPILFIFAAVICTGSAYAQPSNIEVLGSLAVKCLGDIPGPVGSFRLQAGPRMPFLRPYLTRHWLDRGYKVFVGDSTEIKPETPLHVLRYDPESANVTYERLESDSLRRIVKLTIAHSFVTPEGLLVEDSRCEESVSDMILATDVPIVQQEPWEETRGTIPLDRGWRSWAEPVVIGTSIAIVVYLFFSVRS